MIARSSQSPEWPRCGAVRRGVAALKAIRAVGFCVDFPVPARPVPVREAAVKRHEPVPVERDKQDRCEGEGFCAFALSGGSCATRHPGALLFPGFRFPGDQRRRSGSARSLRAADRQRRLNLRRRFMKAVGRQAPNLRSLEGRCGTREFGVRSPGQRDGIGRRIATAIPATGAGSIPSRWQFPPHSRPWSAPSARTGSRHFCAADAGRRRSKVGVWQWADAT